jgi:hypothetical protein
MHKPHLVCYNWFAAPASWDHSVYISTCCHVFDVCRWAGVCACMCISNGYVAAGEFFLRWLADIIIRWRYLYLHMLLCATTLLLLVSLAVWIWTRWQKGGEICMNVHAVLMHMYWNWHDKLVSNRSHRWQVNSLRYGVLDVHLFFLMVVQFRQVVQNKCLS